MLLLNATTEHTGPRGRNQEEGENANGLGEQKEDYKRKSGILVNYSKLGIFREIEFKM